MPFDPADVSGPVDLQADSQAVRDYKAGRGALAYALRQTGWSEEQIHNSLRTHFESVSAVLADHILSRYIGDRRGRGTVSAWQVAQEIASDLNPDLI
ncbi:hypothetical protein ACFW2V_13875 [Streptomyces sp. NPDC058947]|uniref:hypothetical protein n=1 Tax=Streptomyces sp. NPDC058947 TaxID=3346675 RepID=UPI0036B9DD3F